MSTPSTISARLAAIRTAMDEVGVDAALVRSTDAFFNEYVPKATSTRAWATGFTGSMGDAIVTKDTVHLIVDGRYELQSAQECPDFERTVLPISQTIESGWLALLPTLGITRLAVETDRVGEALYSEVTACGAEAGFDVVPTPISVVETARATLGETPERASGKVWAVGADLSGRTVKERLALVEPLLDAHKLDAYLVMPLDTIAWFCNLRGSFFPYQATFPATALVGRREVMLGTAAHRHIHNLKQRGDVEDEVVASTPRQFLASFRRSLTDRAIKGPIRVGYDAAMVSQAWLDALQKVGIITVAVEDPLAEVKALKTEAELRHMRSAFARADKVVASVRRWLTGRIGNGLDVTEAEVAREVKRRFKRSGAWGLSFNPICGSGPNGAIIHYGTPDAEKAIPHDALFLLDTGAYYEGGYATDLTRTWIPGRFGKPTDRHKHHFTAVLKGAIAGMSARFPKGTTGAMLDAIVRAPLWGEGLDYGHGTGHGVGVNVHEFPPRIAPSAHVELKVGHVFSIEPGVYVDGWGGIRIENLCTVVEDPDNPNMLCVQPLTFSPFDTRLIARRMLDTQERAFLAWFQECAALPHDTMPGLPPRTYEASRPRD